MACYKKNPNFRLPYSAEDVYLFCLWYLMVSYLAVMYAHTVAAADSFFLSFGAALIACFQDLMDQFSEIDEANKR